MKTVLNAGCGPVQPDKLNPIFRNGQWQEVRLDIDPNVQPDVIGSITDLSQIADGAYDAVWSSHNIEHLYAHEVEIALKEINRVLNPDGFLLITLPDLQAVAQYLAEDRGEETLLETRVNGRPGPPITAMDILFGDRSQIRQGRTYMAHRYGFTKRTLGESLFQAGFRTVAVTRRPTAFDLWAIAYKSEGRYDESFFLSAIR